MLPIPGRECDLETAAYPQQAVLKVTGITAATLQNWANRRIIKLTQQNPGRQARRLYSQLDMMRLVTLAELTRVGISTARAAEFAEEVVVKHAFKLKEIDAEQKRTGVTTYGQACRAHFYYDNGEMKCLMEPNALSAMATGFYFGLREDVVTITVDVSRIVYFVQIRLCELASEECDPIIEEHEKAGTTNT